MNSIDREAIEKAKWIKDYCKKHIINNCEGCIFLDFMNKSVFHGEVCILKRNTPDLWK